jgi:hypothetical protein
LAVYLAGTAGHLGQHAKGLGAALGSARFVLILIGAGVIFVCVLAVPVLSDRFLGFAAAQGAKIAVKTFLVGAVVLLVGLALHVVIIDLIGGGLMGLVILGVILDNYLSVLAPAGPTSLPVTGCR